MGNSVSSPAVVMRPILLPLLWPNHRAPSVPTVMPPSAGRLVSRTQPCRGVGTAVGTGKRANCPSGVRRPTALIPWAPNHRAPSGPAVRPAG
jgi:hypothetical protein